MKQSVTASLSEIRTITGKVSGLAFVFFKVSKLDTKSVIYRNTDLKAFFYILLCAHASAITNSGEARYSGPNKTNCPDWLAGLGKHAKRSVIKCKNENVW